MAEGNSKFAFGMLTFAMVMTLLLPIALNLFSLSSTAAPLNTDEQLSGYYDFTGTSPSKEAIWSLTGIYTPYGVDADGNADTVHYGYSDDGWLYGTSIQRYSPSQYRDGSAEYTVVKGADGLFRYAYGEGDTVIEYPAGDHRSGDLYTDVSFDKDKKSPIFFTQALKHEQDGHFYYQFGGYRYAFQPTSSYTTQTSDGDQIEVIANTTSLSLIWYQYYTSAQSGISGQLIISSQDFQVAYLTASQIIQAFNSTTSTARFVLNFQGVPINLYIKIDPTQLSKGLSIQQCYDLGYWSVMVTSLSTESSAYTQSDNALNPYNIFETIVDILTFNYADFGISESLGVFCSLLIVVPFYLGLIAICLGGGIQMIIGVGLLAAVQAIATISSKWNIFG